MTTLRGVEGGEAVAVDWLLSEERAVVKEVVESTLSLRVCCWSWSEGFLEG